MTAEEISGLLFEQLTGDERSGFIDPLNETAIGAIRTWCDAIGQQIHDRTAVPVVPRYSSAGRPAAEEALLGRIIRVKDTDLPEEVQLCVEQSTGGFEWIVLGISSS